MTRPEDDIFPPQIHYKKSKSYALSSRLNYIQREITNKCLSFMNIKENGLVLDLGCGTGISGFELARNGLNWIGCDISKDMLNEINEQNEFFVEDINENNLNNEEQKESENSLYDKDKNLFSSENEEFFDDKEISNISLLEKEIFYHPAGLFNLDIANKLPFKPGSFDAVISVSCIQWLFHNKNLIESRSSFRNLFTSVKSVLKMQCVAVFQIYNIHKDHLQIMNEESLRAGFYSRIVNEGEGRNKKTFLILDYKNRQSKKTITKTNKIKDEIARRKERRIKKGLKVAKDSKYTGRKRSKKL
ncbi:hypothetical protein GVAV_000245 [Gurleya vavrai]